MAIAPFLGAVAKEALIGLAMWGGWELGKRGIGWIARKAASKWAARKGAQAAAQAVATMEVRNLMQQALANYKQRFEELRRLAEEARAAGNMTLARSYERQLTQLMAEYSKLVEVAQIGREKWWDRGISLLGMGALVGFTVEEWRQTTMFSKNLDKMKEIQEEREEIERAKIAAMYAMIGTMKEKMMADERGRAFWAWYLQQKINWELMRQQSLSMKRAIASVRRKAGSQVSKVGEKILLEQVKAYYKALEHARKRQLEWEKFWQSVNLENVKALNEQQAIAMRARWEAWVDALKTANEMREQLHKTVLDMIKQYQEAALKSQLKREEYALKAQLEQLETMLAEHKMRLAHMLEMEKMEIERQYERTNTAIAQVYENVKQYLKTLAEMKNIANAKDIAKEGKQRASEVRYAISEETTRLLVDYGKELLEQMKRAGKLSLEPRTITRTVAVIDPSNYVAWRYRR